MNKIVTLSVILAVLILPGLVWAMGYFKNKTEPPRVKTEPPIVQAEPPSASVPDAESGLYMFNVTLHTADEIDGLLKRAEMLSKTTRSIKNGTGIALVLHGPEIKIFRRANYDKYRQLVDKAAKLDGDNVVEIKICKTKMDALGIGEEELPGFIEVIPYAPDEEKRLKRNGYVTL